MAKNTYNIVKTAEGRMTTYRVIGTDVPCNAAIFEALTEAAHDVWQYLTTIPGTYTAEQLVRKNGVIMLRDGIGLPAELTEISVECGAFKCGVGLKDWDGRDNYIKLFAVLAEFERQARVKQNERAMFTAHMELGELVCEARIILPTDIRAICCLCGCDLLRPSLACPALDLDRQCIVATDCAMMVAKKVTVSSIRYEDKVPETFCLPKEVALMQGEVTVKLFEYGCAVTDENGMVAEVEHIVAYPKWHAVWPKYRGGMTIVDSKVVAKAVRCAANGLPERGKSDREALLMTHYPASVNLRICGYEGSEIVNTQTIPDCIATDEVAWRVPVNAVRLQKVLALKPKLMWAGYTEYGTLPDRIVLEDMEAQMAVMLYHCLYEELDESMRETDATYAVVSESGLHHCYDPDGWLLEQVETKYPTCGEKPEPKPAKKAKVFTKSAPKEAAKAAPANKETNIAAMLRARLAVLLAA